jgi:acetolactate decarboxylase
MITEVKDMVFRKVKPFIAACLVLLSAVACFASDETITQISTIDALMAGVYDGVTTLGELRKNGDFGTGTFDRLDGEMILLDGVFYQVTVDGAVKKPDLGTKTPFAAVTFFTADRSVKLNEGSTFQEFTNSTEKGFPSRNIFLRGKNERNFSVSKGPKRAVPEKTLPAARRNSEDPARLRIQECHGDRRRSLVPSLFQGYNHSRIPPALHHGR